MTDSDAINLTRTGFTFFKPPVRIFDGASAFGAADAGICKWPRSSVPVEFSGAAW